MPTSGYADQIYDVDPIEAPTELKVLQTISIRESLFAPFDAERPLGVEPADGCEACCSSAQQLAVPPVDRLRVLNGADALAVCFTVLVPFLRQSSRTRRLGAAREVVWKCAEKEKSHSNGSSRDPAIVPRAILRCDIVVRTV